ncbi:MAG: hypothetical protein R3E90_05930 [Marinicella sp.]
MKCNAVCFLLITFLSVHASNGEEKSSLNVLNPIMFVTQFPIAADFATIGSTFGNHLATMKTAGRGGDLYIRYPDGTLRNLTREAGFGMVGFQGEQAIAVRDPSVHWSGQKALFSMVIGAPAEQYDYNEYYWQIYEASGLGQGEQVQIQKVLHQPDEYNNISPIYGSDDAIIFTSDMPRTKNRYNYPQRDEYESTPTNTGVWQLKNGQVKLFEHAPSGSFNPMIDSFGRIVFTRWDHLQRDQQASPVNTREAFNYTNETSSGIAVNEVTEVFPEPRPPEVDLMPGTNLLGHRFNHFFPWQINQDGTELETLNHVGRHEFHSYFTRSFNDDDNLISFNQTANRPNQNSINNTFYLSEHPNIAGRYVAVDAPEFQTHGAGQLVQFDLPVGAIPSLVEVAYLSHEATRVPVSDNQTAPPEHVGFFRNPIFTEDNVLMASHTAETRQAANEGSRAFPEPRYDFTIKKLSLNSEGHYEPSERLTNLGDVSVSFYDADVLVTYHGPLWELSPVEVKVKPVPPYTSETLQDPELQVFAEENIDLNLFQNFLRTQSLALVVMRDVTTRDELDLQQPYNLRVAGTEHQSIGAPGFVYDIAHMQFFQGNQVRGYGGIDSPSAGQRVLAEYLNDPKAVANNIPLSGTPPASAKIYDDGSVAFFVPAHRATSWQTTDSLGEAVVRERYWISFQPGEIRACGGCHGVNEIDQTGALPSLQKPEALRDLLRYWDEHFEDLIFKDGFE